MRKGYSKSGKKPERGMKRQNGSHGEWNLLKRKIIRH